MARLRLAFLDFRNGIRTVSGGAGRRFPGKCRPRPAAPGLALAFALLVSAAAAPSQAEERQFLFGDGLTLVFEERDRTLAEQLWPRIAGDRSEIMNRFALHPEGTLRIVLAPTAEAFHQAMGGFMPGALGAYFPATRTIVLRSPRTEPGGQWDLRGVARHELAHGVLDLAIGQPIPRWLNEGLAILLADELSFLDDSKLTWLAFRERLVPLALLMEGFPEGQHALDTAYAQAASFARFLLRRGGMEGIRRLLERLADGKTAARAFPLAYGASLPELERDWQEELSGRFSWFAFVTPLSVLGGVGAPLVVLGWLRRRLEARRRFKQWEAEGEPEPPAGDPVPELPAPSRPSAAHGLRRLRLWRKPGTRPS